MSQYGVIGLDLSLSSTGIACSMGWTQRIRVPATGRTMDRLRTIRNEVLSWVRQPRLVVVEGLAVGSQTGQHLTRAGMWHLVMEAIDARGLPWAEVPPTTLKRYATGKGNAGKDEVLAAVIKRFPTMEIRGNDEADALVLAAMGADWLGEPMAAMPETHRAALGKVRWPELVADGR